MRCATVLAKDVSFSWDNPDFHIKNKNKNQKTPNQQSNKQKAPKNSPKPPVEHWSPNEREYAHEYCDLLRSFKRLW